MLVKCYVALFLALVFVQFYASIDAKHQKNQTINDGLRGFEITFTIDELVQIIDEFPHRWASWKPQGQK
jgi:hypothetical protein